LVEATIREGASLATNATASRARATIALINETNGIWQQTNEFRSQIADQQSRDVGCARG